MFFEKRNHPRIDLRRQRPPGIRERYREVGVAQQALIVRLVPKGAVQLFEEAIYLVSLKHLLLVAAHSAGVHHVLNARGELHGFLGSRVAVLS